jgi:DNA-binding transcriptional LysR family regulator
MPPRMPSWHERIGRRVKLRDLHILSTVVARGSMAQGAKHLGMSQPAVSEAIASLEAALAVRLLERSTRGIEPTIYAEVLLRREHAVFDELKQAVSEIESLADPTAGEVRIGCPESMTAAFVPDIIARLCRQYPRLVVHLLNAQTAEQGFRELRERRVDVMIGRLLRPISDEDIRFELLCQDDFCVVTGANSQLSRRRSTSYTELLNEPWILFPPGSLMAAYIEDALRSKGLEPPRHAITSFSLHVRMHLLADGNYLSIMFGSVFRRHRKRWTLGKLPIDLGIPPVPIGLFTLKDRALSPTVGLFIEECRRYAKSP